LKEGRQEDSKNEGSCNRRYGSWGDQEGDAKELLRYIKSRNRERGARKKAKGWWNW
jgi:hypothetical protein